MDTNNTTGEALPVEQTDASPALSTDAASNTSSQPKETMEALSLEELNKLTGKNFTTKDSALKAISDTFSFVGKKKETVAEELKTTGEYISRKELDTEFFYKENQTATANRKIVDAFASANKMSAREAYNSPELKSLLEKAKGYDDSQSVKSVIETNPKLASVRSGAETIKTMVTNGNRDAAGLEAARILRESLDLS